MVHSHSRRGDECIVSVHIKDQWRSYTKSRAIFTTGYYAWDYLAMLIKQSDTDNPSPVRNTSNITVDYPGVTPRVSPGVSPILPHVLVDYVIMELTNTRPYTTLLT